MGEADSRNCQGRFLSDDYTMADLIRNSDAREASRLKESELRDQILIENEKKELKSHLDSWIEGNNNALSYMYLFGKDFHDSKKYFQKHGMHYEHSASELESIRLKEYLNNFITDEQRVQLREEYNKIMNAPKDDWQNQLLKNHMLTNAATMNQFGQQNEVDLAAQVQEIHDYNKEVKDSDNFGTILNKALGKSRMPGEKLLALEPKLLASKLVEKYLILVNRLKTHQMHIRKSKKYTRKSEKKFVTAEVQASGVLTLEIQSMRKVLN